MAGILLPDHSGTWRLTVSRGGPRAMHAEFPAYPDVLGDDPLIVVPDLSDDPRFVNPLNRDQSQTQLRFMAAARFETPNNIRGPGYLCLFDVRPRQLRIEDRRTLCTLAEAAGEELAEDNHPSEPAQTVGRGSSGLIDFVAP